MEDINPLMAVTDLNLTVHPHLHLMVHLPQHMAVMAKPTHHLHLMNLMVHLNPQMAIMAKTAQHPQHMENIAKLPHHNLKVHISLIFLLADYEGIKKKYVMFAKKKIHIFFSS